MTNFKPLENDNPVSPRSAREGMNDVQARARCHDYDRPGGVTIRVAGTLEVYAYKNEPGVFYDQHCHPVSDEIARQAGFDVDALRAERRKRERLEKARAEIDALMQSELSKAREAAEVQ